MKEIIFSKKFEKSYKKRIAPHGNIRKRFDKRYSLFVDGEHGSPLFDHALSGKFAGKRAFSIGGDLRVIYQEFDDHFLFIDVGTHAQVYDE